MLPQFMAVQLNVSRRLTLHARLALQERSAAPVCQSTARNNEQFINIIKPICLLHMTENVQFILSDFYL